MFLPASEWHKLNNIATVTYGCILCIHLCAFKKRDTSTLLCYAAFALVWIAQLKDEYWMDKTQYTVGAVSIFGLLPFAKALYERAFPELNWQLYLRGVLLAVPAFICFVLGLNSDDWLRHWHGLSHIFFGATLYYLWSSIIPKKQAHLLPSHMGAQWV